MDGEIYTFGRADMDDIHAMLREWRLKKNSPPAYQPPPLAYAPDVYIARTPASGIPARQGDKGSGSPGSPGTGTDSAAYDTFSAQCRCYRIDDSVSSDVDVFLMDRILPVYNLGNTAIPGKTIVLAVKDKTGKWIATQLGGQFGSGSLFVQFTLSNALATTDASQPATVDSYFGGANPGSSITVYNKAASSNYIFSGASGHKGWAVYDATTNKFWILNMECP